VTKSEHERVTEAYAHVGAVATGFAALEFHLQFVLSILISGKEVSPEALLVTRSKSFGQKIELLKELVELRLPKRSDLRRVGIELVTELDALRKKRNLYIHGYWLINYQLLVSTDGVRCSDTKWRFDKRTDSWKTMETIDISLDELRKQGKANGALFTKLHDFNNQLLKEFVNNAQRKA
jgi:hypothetical protein